LVALVHSGGVYGTVKVVGVFVGSCAALHQHVLDHDRRVQIVTETKTASATFSLTMSIMVPRFPVETWFLNGMYTFREM
jgi:hypothetical protein